MKLGNSAVIAAPVLGLLVWSAAIFGFAESGDSDHGSHLGLSEEIVPYKELGKNLNQRDELITEKIEDAIFPSNRERKASLEERPSHDNSTVIPDRKTLFGKGDRFLSTGPISDGVTLGTGANWRPFLVVWGQFRSGLQAFKIPGSPNVREWVNRLDILADLYLTQTERIHVGFRPLDEEGVFSGYQFRGPDRGSTDGFNFEPETLFFEGEFGEIFPGLDQNDRFNLDYGFAIGRQPVFFQEGIMVNDIVDGVGIARNNMFLFGSSASRVTAFWAGNEIHRNDNLLDPDAQLVALFSVHDFDKATVEVDAAYVRGGARAGDGLYTGISHTRRFGYWNSTLRANGSWALNEESPAVSTGYLFTHELSRTMTYNEDILYCNAFWGLEDYASAARAPSAGGPLGRMGLLYESVGLGTYGAALGNRPNDSLGFAFGYQHFIDDAHKQLVIEVGGRHSTTSGGPPSAAGVGLRYQQALNRHAIFVVDGYATLDDSGGSGYGTRMEIRIKF